MGGDLVVQPSQESCMLDRRRGSLAAGMEFGLGLLNFVAVITAISGAQLGMQKYWGALTVADAVMLAALCVGLYLAGCRWIERRKPTELSIRQAGTEMPAGIFLGLALFSCVMLVLWMGRVYQLEGWGSYRQLGPGLSLAVLGGFVEEILFRGILFRAGSKLTGSWGALLLTSALFGAAHAANRGATLSSSLAIALEAGILLGAAYAATGRLWVPIGLHMGWNFAEGSIFGMTLSGNAMGAGLIRGTLSGRQILTGGEFGPEASIVAVILCFAAAVYFLRRMVKQKLAEAPVWRRGRQQMGVLQAAVTP